VKIYLDECIDWRFARHIVGHDVKTARDMSWTGLKNGALLALVAAQSDAFVTVDRNLSFQQNTGAYPIAILVTHAHSNRLADLIPLVPALLKAVDTASVDAATIIDAKD
jgi:ribonuclease BN (tRNA processing enzyme)